MTRREWKTVLILLACLTALSALGVWFVLFQAAPARVAAFAGRFLDCRALGFTAPDGITLTAEKDLLRVQWDEGGANGFEVTSQSIPLNAANRTRVLADARISGTRNADGNKRFGFRAWLEIDLLREGATLKSARMELPLESDKERARLYSLAATYDGLAPDACRMRLTVEPLDGSLSPGTLQCAWLEVTPQ